MRRRHHERSLFPALVQSVSADLHALSSAKGELVDKPDYSEAKIVVAMVSLHLTASDTVELTSLKVGLPARGKSYLCNKLMRYLRVRKSLLNRPPLTALVAGI